MERKKQIKLGTKVYTPRTDLERERKGTVIWISGCGRFVRVKKMEGNSRPYTNEYRIEQLTPIITGERHENIV